jgi:catechol 2,3-dioxygenase-like lactoylglutathione lyase family enzyme
MSVPKLAHIVLQTNRLQGMRDWYCRLRDARVVYENPAMAAEGATHYTASNSILPHPLWALVGGKG